MYYVAQFEGKFKYNILILLTAGPIMDMEKTKAELNIL